MWNPKPAFQILSEKCDCSQLGGGGVCWFVQIRADPPLEKSGRQHFRGQMARGWWADAKREWGFCCQHEGLGCATPTSRDAECGHRSYSRAARLLRDCMQLGHTAAGCHHTHHQEQERSKQNPSHQVRKRSRFPAAMSFQQHLLTKLYVGSSPTLWSRC